MELAQGEAKQVVGRVQTLPLELRPAVGRLLRMVDGELG